MIIDLHTHVWASVDQLGPEVARRLRERRPEAWGEFDGSPAAHTAAMQCVDGSIIMGFQSDLLGAHIPNEYVADFVARDPSRRVGIAGIDPMSEDADDQLERAVELGLNGVTISPARQGFHPTHSNAMRLYEKCAAHGLPLVVTMDDPLTPSAILEFGRPAKWDEVAQTYPDLPIVISQLGHPWIEETLLLLGKHRSVYADISAVVSRPWQLYNALLSASSQGVMDRLLFGSGFPRTTPTKAIEAIYSVNVFCKGAQLPSIPRTQIRDIVERDSLSLLGIDAPFAKIRRGRDADDRSLDETVEFSTATKAASGSGRHSGSA